MNMADIMLLASRERADRVTDRALDKTHQWPVRVYIAGRYEDQAELRQFALDQERELGWKIVSRWLWSPLTREQCKEAGLELQEAQLDLDEIEKCDVMIVDTHNTTETGGREVEIGYAMRAGKIVLRRGPVRNIFHHLLPEIEL